MPPRMRLPLNTRPRLIKRRSRQAGSDIGLGRAPTGEIADLPVDAVLCVLVSRAERVGVVGKGPVGDAPVATAAVAAEAVGWVEED